ncbi:hypothetical protein [Amycolatopsis orientalis]|uniref:hypothetical protein n=1 Tax=Amycolatopsis orientalis TaxID=31958 RepID=UPI001319E515|nr:hypothetical protein [Amycolatopsis orientalis]
MTEYVYRVADAEGASWHGYNNESGWYRTIRGARAALGYLRGIARRNSHPDPGWRVQRAALEWEDA